MKRISILVTVLMAGSAYAVGPMHGGRAGHAGRVAHTAQPVRIVHPVQRVQHGPSMVLFAYGRDNSDGAVYSPYALGFGNPGLVPGTLRYSPYALGFGSSGLIPDNVQYSPYAMDSQRSGLISEVPYASQPCAGWAGTSSRRDPATASFAAGRSYAAAGSLSSGTSSQVPSRSSCGPVLLPAEAVRTEAEPAQPAVVKAYLDKVSPGRYQITRVLCIDDEPVCFDVVLSDRNVVVKYWNGRKIQAIKRQGDYRQKALTRYLQDWMEYRDQWEANGGKVVHVASDDTYELLNKIGCCLQTDNS